LKWVFGVFFTVFCGNGTDSCRRVSTENIAVIQGKGGFKITGPYGIKSKDAQHRHEAIFFKQAGKMTELFVDKGGLMD